MKRAKAERSLVVMLFVMALVMYSFAQRDTKRVAHIYTDVVKKAEQILASYTSPHQH